SRIGPAANAYGFAPVRASAGSSGSPPISAATSRNGARGRGVTSASHAPDISCTVAGNVAANRRTSAVLPTPASPATKASRPPAREVTASSCSARAASSADRSRRLASRPAAVEDWAMVVGGLNADRNRCPIQAGRRGRPIRTAALGFSLADGGQGVDLAVAVPRVVAGATLAVLRCAVADRREERVLRELNNRR